MPHRLHLAPRAAHRAACRPLRPSANRRIPASSAPASRRIRAASAPRLQPHREGLGKILGRDGSAHTSGPGAARSGGWPDAACSRRDSARWDGRTRARQSSRQRRPIGRVQRMPGLVTQDAHQPLAVAALHLVHEAALQPHQPRLRQEERQRDARHAVRREPFLRSTTSADGNGCRARPVRDTGAACGRRPRRCRAAVPDRGSAAPAGTDRPCAASVCARCLNIAKLYPRQWPRAPDAAPGQLSRPQCSVKCTLKPLHAPTGTPRSVAGVKRSASRAHFSAAASSRVLPELVWMTGLPSSLPVRRHAHLDDGRALFLQRTVTHTGSSHPPDAPRGIAAPWMRSARNARAGVLCGVAGRHRGPDPWAATGIVSATGSGMSGSIHGNLRTVGQLCPFSTGFGMKIGWRRQWIASWRIDDVRSAAILCAICTSGMMRMVISAQMNSACSAMMPA